MDAHAPVVNLAPPAFDRVRQSLDLRNGGKQALSRNLERGPE